MPRHRSFRPGDWAGVYSLGIPPCFACATITESSQLTSSLPLALGDSCYDCYPRFGHIGEYQRSLPQAYSPTLKNNMSESDILPIMGRILD
jgi:hypothetical protein